MKPKLLNGDMVRAVLDERKTNTRVPIKGLGGEWIYSGPNDKGDHLFVPADWELRSEGVTECTVIRKHPHQVGDILYVREAVKVQCYTGRTDFAYGAFLVEYCADGKLVKCPDELEEWWRHNWHVRPSTRIPSIHMKKELARIFLKVTAVSVEQIQNISAEDAKAEGIDWGHTKPFPKKKHQDTISNLWDLKHEIINNRFKPLWESVYPGSWERNDWVWKTEFERTEKP